jgi:hypothetical protein
MIRYQETTSESRLVVICSVEISDSVIVVCGYVL